MDYNVLDDLRELDILIKKRLFLIGKRNCADKSPSPLQVKIFRYLYLNKDKEVSQADLVNELRVSKVAISEAISKMVNNGNIKVVPSMTDHRKNILSYTDQGIKIMNQMVLATNLLNKELIRNIDLNELNTFVSVMQQLKKNIKEDDYV